MNEYAAALEHSKICNQVYQQYVDDSRNAGPGVPINWVELERLARRANEADSTLVAIMNEVQATPCTCNDRTGSVCAPCYMDNWERYADTIPYKDYSEDNDD